MSMVVGLVMPMIMVIVIVPLSLLCSQHRSLGQSCSSGKWHVVHDEKENTVACPQWMKIDHCDVTTNNLFLANIVHIIVAVVAAASIGNRGTGGSVVGGARNRRRGNLSFSTNRCHQPHFVSFHCNFLQQTSHLHSCFQCELRRA